MIDLSWSEILIIAIVMIVVVGPKDLPKMLRSFGRTMSKVRSMAGDFRKQFDEALKEAELEDLKSLADDARKLNPASEIRKAMNPVEQAAKDVRTGLDKAMKPATPISAEKPASTSQSVEPKKTAATAMPDGMTREPDASAPAKTPVKAAKPARAAASRPKPAVKKGAIATDPSAPATKTPAKARAPKAKADK